MKKNNKYALGISLFALFLGLLILAQLFVVDDFYLRIFIGIFGFGFSMVGIKELVEILFSERGKKIMEIIFLIILVGMVIAFFITLVVLLVSNLFK